MTKQTHIILNAWKLFTGTIHITIGVIAALSYGGFIAMSPDLLAFLIASANFMTAIRHIVEGTPGNAP